MKEILDKAIEVLAGKAKSSIDGIDALRLSQAALNLSHINLHISQIKGQTK